MRTTRTGYLRAGRGAALLMLLALLLSLALPVGAAAQEQEKFVRVGWFDSPFNRMDELGRRSGYAYEYQQKLAAYTGWTFEYVEGSWSELMEMLADGRIDLLSDVCYTPERAERMLFSALPMGEEKYFLYADSGNQTIRAEDYASINGRTIGANRGSVQLSLFRHWAAANGVRAELVELTGTEEENLAKLARGEIDLYLAPDGYSEEGAAVPVCEIGSSEFFFAVNSRRPDLLVALNNAMNRVRDEEPEYNRLLYAKYIQSSSVNRYLSAEETAWLEEHGPIRVGYQDQYLAFCAQDSKTGELTGALKDYLDAAADCLEGVHLDFVPVCYPSSAEAMEAMRSGEVDCVFPANLTPYDGEERGVFLTPALMHTDMSAVVRAEDRDGFSRKERVAVAVNVGNPNYDMFLLDHFPDWRAIYFEDTPACLRAIADRQADCLLISNYRYNNIARLCERGGLVTISTGVEMDYSLAVDRSNTQLYAILAKTTELVPSSTVNAALTYYFTEDARLGMLDSFRQNLSMVAAALGAAVLVLLALLLYRTRKAKRAADRAPAAEDFRLMDELPISCSVYRVTHAVHSERYDAEIVYVNRRFEQLGGIPAEELLGRSVRETFLNIDEEWYRNAKRAALDGEAVTQDYTDPLSGKTFHYFARQIIEPGYCLVTYQEC